MLVDKDFFQRIIPTRVGTRQTQADRFQKVEDHPHACGDKHLTACAVPFVSGSSPRVWGQVTKINDNPTVKGIIPTRVGTSYPMNLFYSMT